MNSNIRVPYEDGDGQYFEDEFLCPVCDAPLETQQERMNRQCARCTDKFIWQNRFRY